VIWGFRGVVHSKTDNAVILEVNNVFYEVFLCTKYSVTFHTGEEVFLYIREAVRENAPVELIGFVNEDERTLYDALIKINGIGPKNALKILDVTDLDAFVRAVESKDTLFLKSLPGIGTKTAERIILELSGKFHFTANTDDHIGESVETMMALGFSRNEAFEAVKNAVESGAEGLEEIVKSALSSIKKN